MNHKALITPLNCAFGTGMNALIKMENSEFSVITDRGIYCKSPDVSWYQMKAITATPYLEPAFYGVKPGDIIEVEFSAMALSGNPKMTVPFLKIGSDYAALGITTLDTEVLTTYFKKYKIRYMIPASFDGIGIILNFRQNIAPSEVIMKNIEVTIDTSNPLFSIAYNITEFRTKTDYMKCIDYYSGTNLNTVYNSLKNLHSTEKIVFPDDETMQFVNAGTISFKGLMTLFNGHKYRPNFAVYTEYVSSFSITATSKNVKEDGTFTQDGSYGFPPSASIRKVLQYFNGSISPGRKSFVDLGAVASGGDFTIKNVRFSMSQFDDSVKREPNLLDELYTNLSAKLR